MPGSGSGNWLGDPLATRGGWGDPQVCVRKGMMRGARREAGQKKKKKKKKRSERAGSRRRCPALFFFFSSSLLPRARTACRGALCPVDAKRQRPHSLPRWLPYQTGVVVEGRALSAEA